MEITTMTETLSKQVKRLETEINGYKVVVNTTINNGKIESLNGNVYPATAKEGEYVEGNYFNAYKRNGEWRTDISEVANDKYAEVSEITIAAVNYAVKKYETA